MSNTEAFTAAAAQLVESAAGIITTAAHQVDAMDGRTAFLVGMVTWFLVENAVRRFAGGLRTAILVTALAGTGYALVGIVNSTQNLAN